MRAEARFLGGEKASKEVHGRKVLCEVDDPELSDVPAVSQGSVPKAPIRGRPSVHARNQEPTNCKEQTPSAGLLQGPASRTIACADHDSAGLHNARRDDQ